MTIADQNFYAYTPQNNSYNYVTDNDNIYNGSCSLRLLQSLQ